MLIRLGYDMQFEAPSEVPIVALLNVHPSRKQYLLEPDFLKTDPVVNIENYHDTFGNICCRFVAPPGKIRLHNSTLIEDSGKPDLEGFDAQENNVEHLPHDVLPYLMNSRYCEVDLLSNTASELFGHTPKGWQRVREVCTWVHNKVTFGYEFANPTRTALGVYTERVGVCRDFQHLAITFCRALNIPRALRHRIPRRHRHHRRPSPMDFSAWFEVYLGDRWWTLDARHNIPRIGRVLMAVGRDATDCALTTSFGRARLLSFKVVSDEVPQRFPPFKNKRALSRATHPSCSPVVRGPQMLRCPTSCPPVLRVGSDWLFEAQTPHLPMSASKQKLGAAG